MNPINGGTPLSDRMRIIRGTDISILLFSEFNVFLYIMINVGIIITEYISKYRIENDGLLIIMNLVIHPMWVIDEKAMIDFILVWFIPIIEPIMAFSTGRTIDSLDEFIINVNTHIGANFCHVDRSIHDDQEIDVITDGNHIWHGAMPSLINIEITREYIINVLFILRSYHHIAVDIIKKIDEPIACTRKYLSIASDSWNLFDE
jgi:hypothetical protein